MLAGGLFAAILFVPSEEPASRLIKIFSLVLRSPQEDENSSSRALGDDSGGSSSDDSS